MPAGSSAGDAITVDRYSLSADGVEIAQFSELVGMTSESEPTDIAGSILKKLPGKQTSAVVLRRALTADLHMSAWHEAALEGPTLVSRKSATVVMFDTAGRPVARFELEYAWPSKIEFGSLKSGTNDVLSETVTFAFKKLRRVAP